MGLVNEGVRIERGYSISLTFRYKKYQDKKISSYVSSLLTWSNSGMGRGYSVSFIQLFDRK